MGGLAVLACGHDDVAMFLFCPGRHQVYESVAVVIRVGKCP